MRIAIVDDDPQMRKQLSDYVYKFGKENSIPVETVTFGSGDEILDGYKPEYGIIIFDIDMPGMNGMDTARKIREMDEKVVILFVTNIAQYAINGYEVEAVDYILKPIGYFDFALKFQRAMRRALRQDEDLLVINTVRGPVRVRAVDILYIEVLAHYLIYHTEKDTYQVRGSLKEQEEILRQHHFCRSHKSYLVNLRKIDNIRSSEVWIGELRIPLGRTCKDDLMAAYMKYLRG